MPLKISVKRMLLYYMNFNGLSLEYKSAAHLKYDYTMTDSHFGKVMNRDDPLRDTREVRT